MFIINVYIIETEFGMKLTVRKTNTELLGQDNSFVAGDQVMAVWRNSHVAQIPV